MVTSVTGRYNSESIQKDDNVNSKNIKMQFMYGKYEQSKIVTQ